MAQHADAGDELDVQGILAFAERILPRLRPVGPGVARLQGARAAALLPGRDRVRRKLVQSNRRNGTAFQVVAPAERARVSGLLVTARDRRRPAGHPGSRGEASLRSRRPWVFGLVDPRRRRRSTCARHSWEPNVAALTPSSIACLRLKGLLGGLRRGREPGPLYRLRTHIERAEQAVSQRGQRPPLHRRGPRTRRGRGRREPAALVR